VEITQQQKEADEILTNAIPELEKAEIALQKINQNEISLLKTISKPHPMVEAVFTMIMMLKPIEGISEGDGWNGARQMMSNPAKFVDELKRFSNRIGNVTEKTITRIRNLSNKEAEGLGRIRDVSSACEQIYNWL
jgi:dynein heavy chain